MFYRYEIRNNGIEDILYLYLDIKTEFSKEISYSNDTNDLKRRTKNFIKNNNIDFKGDKVYLVIDNIVVRSIDIKNKDVDIEVLQSDLFYSNDNYLVNIRNNQSVIQITLREYLLGVLATNFDNALDIEVLKALCVLFRGYIYEEMTNKRCLDVNDKYLNYKPISYYKLSWLDNYDIILNRFNLAINDTDCLFITYNNNYILPFYHFVNYGKTIQSKKYPYLTSVSSLWDLASPFFTNIKDYTYSEISKILNISINNKSKIEFIDVDSDYLLEKIIIDNSVFIGERFIELLSLPSRNICIIMNKDNIRFICRGWGNFFGLSIYGANELAKNGCDYTNIIMYYYPNITINKYVKELSN